MSAYNKECLTEENLKTIEEIHNYLDKAVNLFSSLPTQIKDQIVDMNDRQASILQFYLSASLTSAQAVKKEYGID